MARLTPELDIDEQPRALWKDVFGISPDLEQQDLPKWAAAFAFYIFVLFGPLTAAHDSLTDDFSGSWLRQLGYLLIVGAIFYTANPLKNGLRALAIPVTFAVALAWCAASSLWAINPGISVRRLALTVVVIWASFSIVRSFRYEVAASALRAACVTALICNFVAVFLFPETGMHLGKDLASTAIAGNWRGVMTHKNFAGAVSAIGILMYLFDAHSLKRSVRLLFILASGFFLYKSQSKTSMGMLLIAAVCAYIFLYASKKSRAYVISILCLITTAALFYISAYQGSMLHPDAFTGRGQIWMTLLGFSQDHLALGAGFESFWGIGDASPVYEYGRGFVTSVTVGHNGYLDLLASIGLTGLILCVVAQIIWPLMRLLVVYNINIERGALVCAILVFGVGHNVTESSLFARDSFVGMFMLFAAACSHYEVSAPFKPKNKSKRGGGSVMREMRRRNKAAGESTPPIIY